MISSPCFQIKNTEQTAASDADASDTTSEVLSSFPHSCYSNRSVQVDTNAKAETEKFTPNGDQHAHIAALRQQRDNLRLLLQQKQQVQLRVHSLLICNCRSQMAEMQRAKAVALAEGQQAVDERQTFQAQGMF